GAGAVGLNVFHRWDEARSAKCVRPVILGLLREQLVPAAARQVVKSRGGLGQQYAAHCPVGIFGELHRNQVYAHSAQLGQRGFVEFMVVFAACHGLRAIALFFFTLFLFIFGEFFLLFRWRRL